MERYPLNRGDFYAENGSCIACGAPQAEAPGLIGHAEENHCYFHRQPETPSEIDQAIRAMMVSCVGALRYGGTGELILRRLYENGMSNLCDHQPQQWYPVVVRNRVSFDYAGNLQELSQTLINFLLRQGSHFTISDEVHTAERSQFIKRWHAPVPGSQYICRQDGPERISVTVRSERGPADTEVGRSCFLHDFLQQEPRASRAAWRSQDPEETGVYEKPF